MEPLLKNLMRRACNPQWRIQRLPGQGNSRFASIDGACGNIMNWKHEEFALKAAALVPVFHEGQLRCAIETADADAPPDLITCNWTNVMRVVAAADSHAKAELQRRRSCRRSWIPKSCTALIYQPPVTPEIVTSYARACEEPFDELSASVVSRAA
jgi:hypothetical protein